MKKKLAAISAIGILACAGSVLASPVTFDVDGPTDSYVNIVDIVALGPTTITATLADLDGLVDFTLADNESKTFDFFTFHVFGTGVGSFNLSANLNFDAPVIDVGGDGSGLWVTFAGMYSGGAFFWDQPEHSFTLADGNTISVVMQDGFAFGQGSDATVTATVTNLGGAPVPEPATMLLFGAGLAGLAGVSRKMTFKKK